MKNTPAFPSVNNVIVGNMMSAGHSGMTLRDYFAAKAMQAHLNGLNEDEFCADGVAIMAYQMADAMLKERTR